MMKFVRILYFGLLVLLGWAVNLHLLFIWGIQFIFLLSTSFGRENVTYDFYETSETGVEISMISSEAQHYEVKKYQTLETAILFRILKLTSQVIEVMKF